MKYLINLVIFTTFVGMVGAYNQIKELRIQVRTHIESCKCGR